MPLQYPYNPEAMYIRIAHAEAIREENIYAVCVRAIRSRARTPCIISQACAIPRQHSTMPRSVPA